MQICRLTLQPLSAFGTPLAGDTLFGQLCWTLRHQLGNDRLNSLLDGYTQGRPFVVLSDAMPQGYLPLPTLPSRFWANSSVDRKILKKKRWLPLDALQGPLAQWQAAAHSDTEATQAIAGSDANPVIERAQPHNTINRQTGTTGTGQFAPFSQAQQWFHPAMRFHLYACLDTSRLSQDELLQALSAMGETGYGRDASIGLGKFRICIDDATLPTTPGQHNACLTLGPCAPQGQGFVAAHSYYQPLTRFGRHGDMAVHSGNPFKRPVLLARAGSVFTPETLVPECQYLGQGLTGVSLTQAEAVHQGYSPVIGICLPSD
jgi:CRISPR-associated protein Csm4